MYGPGVEHFCVGGCPPHHLIIVHHVLQDSLITTAFLRQQQHLFRTPAAIVFCYFDWPSARVPPDCGPLELWGLKEVLPYIVISDLEQINKGLKGM